MSDGLKSIYLKPGEMYFGGGAIELKTLLGSCVAITLWHPRRKVGGMCHIMLPSEVRGMCDGRHAPCVLEAFMDHLRRSDTVASDYVVKVFGGGRMFNIVQPTPSVDIGRRNVEASLELLRQHGFKVSHQDVGGPSYRNVCMNLLDGTVAMRSSGQPQKPEEGGKLG
ncbi:MAG: chemotaxis protein CheD [Pseudomonadota bacterium]